MEIIKNIDPFIFRGYDIRGVYGKNLNVNVAYTIGRSYGSYIRQLGQEKCVIGYDNRYSSIELKNALVEGILKSGIDVVLLGLVTTPMYYYASIKLGIPAGIMVTASHNPKDDNGFKISFDERGNARGKMIENFYHYTIENCFQEGEGHLSTYDIHDEYIDLMKNSLSFGSRKVKVVIDLGNGTTSVIAKELYEMFPMDVTVLFGESDSSFPNHHPDPCVESNLDALKRKVIELNADIGIGFDGDGDRLGLVDEKGNYIPTDIYMAIMIRNMIDKVDPKTFLYDVKCSKSLEDEIIKLGGKPFCYRTGNSYTKSKVHELGLPFGGEFSGHVYFCDRFPGFDSGLYAGLRMVELLSRTNKKASELLEGITHYYSTEELKFPTEDTIKFDIVKKIESYALQQGYDTITIDGVKVLFEDGFALVRASNTGPNITARFEAKTQERLEQIQSEFVKIIEINKQLLEGM